MENEPQTKCRLFDIFENLNSDEFEHFKWFLQNSDPREFKKIPKGGLENKTKHDTVDLMFQTYVGDVIEVTRKVLVKIKRNDLLELLPVSIPQASASGTSHGAGPESDPEQSLMGENMENEPQTKRRLFDIFENLNSDEFEHFKWFLQNSDPKEFKKIPKGGLENKTKRDTVDLMFQTYVGDVIEVTRKVLVKIKRNDLLELLPVSIPQASASGTSHGAGPVSDPEQSVEEADPSLSSEMVPSVAPEMVPSVAPEMVPSVAPEMVPSVAPEMVLSVSSEMVPSVSSEMVPSVSSEMVPSVAPEMVPSVAPEMVPSGSKRFEPDDPRNYAYKLTVDMNTVNRCLKLSNNNRKVTCVEDQSYHDHPDRFGCFQLLCREALPDRCYWEVEWSIGVDIAVSYRGIGRRGGSNDCQFGQNDQSWSLGCSDGHSYSVCHNKISTRLSSSSPPASHRAAVYVDRAAGSVSFYEVYSDRLERLHTFSTTFTGKPLYAGFGVSSGASVSLSLFN